MHMADALISPAVGGLMWAASAGVAAHAARRVKLQAEDRLVPLMGVAGAFVFAAQMVNFGIPGTGSSGHLGGGLLLAALLGPCPAFLVMASVLVIQALFFADGGLLALGCNILNLGLFPCFVAYPCFFRPLLKDGSSPSRLLVASLVAGVVGVELGALGVVLQTTLSGRTELPLGTFALVMLPIHLAIGIVEGLATAAVLGFLRQARPDVFPALACAGGGARAVRGVALPMLLTALVVGGVVSWFASDRPDGLEWSLEHAGGSAALAAAEPAPAALAEFQQRTALLPDYDFRLQDPMADSVAAGSAWSCVKPGVSVAGIVGSLLVLLVAGGVGWVSRFAGSLRAQP
jgi:cobalt/nickel transport system permease protein